MATKNHPVKSTKKQMPILARHAVSLSITFVLALVLAYFAWQYMNQQIQLGKLSSPDQETFERGVGYVITKAGESESVTEQSLQAITTIDPQRAADLLLALAQSHANREDLEEPKIPPSVSNAIAPLMSRLDPMQAIGLYDGLVQVKGINPITTAQSLLDTLNPKDDAELLQVVDLLDTRLLWSKHWAPLDLWVRWLGVLTASDSELTQAQTAKRLGHLPEAADDPRIVAALSQLASSRYETVRNIVLHEVAGYAAIAKDPTDYEQLIFNLGDDENPTIARRAWMTVGHLNPLSGFAVDWKNADPIVAEAMLWAAVKTNPENDRPAIDALKTEGYEAAGALALNEWRRPQVPVSNADLIFQQNIREATENELAIAWRSILASKNYMNAEASVIDPYGTGSVENEKLVPLYLAGHWVAAALVPNYEAEKRYSGPLLTAYLEGLFEHGGNSPGIRQTLKPDENWPTFARLLSAAHGVEGIDLDRLVGELPLDESHLLDLFSLALTHAENETIDRFIRSSHPQMVTMAAIASAIKGYHPGLIEGTYTALRKNPDLDIEQIRAMSEDELAALGLRQIDALPALLEAAEDAPPSANRETETKLLKLALWMRGDLGDSFTPTAEAMLHDKEMPASTVLVALLHKQRPVALEYLLGNLVTPRPDTHKLFIQQRYWHVFRRFVDTSNLTLWLWGDPEAQAFQLEAMRQWYAVNRWKIEQGWWPTPATP
jgi:hypothetical protein